jgi:Tol biopolymer transport system component
MKSVRPHFFWFVVFSLLIVFGCSPGITQTVPHQDRWGIYALDLASRDVSLIYTSHRAMDGSVLRLDSRGKTFLFSEKIDGDANENYEICTVGIDGTGFRRLTHNEFWDVYPAWSPDDARIAFLSLRRKDFDIYVMNADGTDDRMFFDSGFHDGDIDWSPGVIAFTSSSRIWTIRDDGTQPRPITDPPRAGEWGKTNLPFGDYDPRISPDGTKVVFERLENDFSPNGNYDFFMTRIDGTGETRLTESGYTQGLAGWDRASRRLVYVVSAINGKGAYDLYRMNADGSENRKISPDYFPNDFLSHAAIFSADDSRILFIGEWWE